MVKSILINAKQTLTLFFIIAITTISYADDHMPDFYSVDVKASDIQPSKYMNAFGLEYSPYAGTLSARQTDLHIPQNGLDINISRVHLPTKTNKGPEGGKMAPRAHFKNWELDVPRIIIRKPPFAGHRYLQECVGGRMDVDIYVPGASDFDPIGKANGMFYPHGAKIRYNNNWLMGCKNYTPKAKFYDNDGSLLPSENSKLLFLVDPNGTIYYFKQTGYDKSYHHVFDGRKLIHDMYIYQVVETVDKFGNWLAYDYQKFIYTEKDYLTPEQYQARLSNIRSSDGANVTLTGSELTIDSISYAGKTIKYEYGDSGYDKQRLKVAHLNHGKTDDRWTFTYSKTQATRRDTIVLSEIKNGYGGSVGLSYLNRNFTCYKKDWNRSQKHNYSNEGSFALSGLSFNLNGIAYPSISFKYSIVDDHHSETEVTHSNKVIKKVFRNCKLRAAPSAKRITKETTLSASGDVVSEKIFEWDRVALPNNVIPGFDDNSGQIVLSSVTTDDTFQTSYSDFDLYGNAKKVTTKNIAIGHTRVTNKTFYSDPLHWIIGKVATVAVSDNGGPEKLIHSTTFHTHNTLGGRFASKGVLYETHNRDGWTSRITDYFDNGLPKRITLNKKLRKSNGDSSNHYRYISFDDYKHGIARSIAFPNRYNDSATLSITKGLDAFGNVIHVTDPANNTRRFKFDNMGRLIASKSVSDEIDWLDQFITYSFGGPYTPFKTTISLCKLNNQLNACESNSVESREVVSYDPFFRVVGKSHYSYQPKFVTREKKFEYDLYGNLKFESFWSPPYSATKGVHFEYDELNRKVREQHYASKAATTSYSGNVKTVVDQEGYTYTTSYRSLGNLNYFLPIVFDYGNSKTVIEYNEFDNVKKIEQNGNSGGVNVSQLQHNVYDRNGRLCKKIRNDIGTTVFSYNIIGEMTWTADLGVQQTSLNCQSSVSAAHKTNFLYDNMGDLHTSTFNDGTPNQRTQYDAVGNLTLAISGDVEKRFEQYKNGRLKGETLLVAGNKVGNTTGGRTLFYSYSPNGGLNSIHYPDGDRVQFNPNGFGEATKVERLSRSGRSSYVYARDITYHESGQIKSFEYGNGLKHTTTHYSNGTVSRLMDIKGSQAVANTRYYYDDRLNTTAIIDKVNPAYSLNTIRYDNLNRMIETQGGSSIGSSKLTYDALGNIRSYSNKLSSLAYNYNESNYHLTSVIDSKDSTNSYTSFRYDKRGNIYNNSKRVFSFNSLNQLTSSSSFTYKYDIAGKRVYQNDSNGEKYSVYANHHKLLYTEDSDGFVNYIYIGGRLIAKDGDVKEFRPRQHYTPFGKSIEGEADDVGYTGHKYDTAIELTYMGARYYDPSIGRFYSNDPVGFTGEIDTFNRYSYVGNNPYKYIDPNGETKRTTASTQSNFNPNQTLINRVGNHLISQIQRYDTTFTYSAVRPISGRGSQMTLRELGALNRTLVRAQSAGFCGPGASSAPNFLSRGGVSMTNLFNNIIPAGTPNTFRGSNSGFQAGFRFQWKTSNGTNMLVWGHTSSSTAPVGSNSANGPTISLRVNNRKVLASGSTVGKNSTQSNSNEAHLPVRK